jgi:hypothetical protein
VGAYFFSSFTLLHNLNFKNFAYLVGEVKLSTIADLVAEVKLSTIAYHAT